MSVSRGKAPPRVQGVKRPPLKNVYIGRFLDRGHAPPQPFANNAEVSRYIVDQALRELGTPITGPDPETDELLARMMASEIAASIHRSGAKTSRHWYTDAIERTKKLAGLLYPELHADDLAHDLSRGALADSRDAQTVLFVAMALTSQSTKVGENMRFALEQYEYFRAHGRLLPKRYGARGASVASNIHRFNLMLDTFDGDISRVRDFLASEFTVRDIVAAAAEQGIHFAPRDLMDTVVNGSVLFGPKIGSFYQNLSGNFATLTMDLWFCRTWGRYTGTLMRDDAGPERVERLSAALDQDLLGRFAAMQEVGQAIVPNAIADLENDELLDTAKEVKRRWEILREALVDVGFNNDQISVFKRFIGWPGAAEAVVKAIGGTSDAPTSPRQRQWMRAVTGRAVQILNRLGYEVTIADAQALLWFPEKDLFDWLAGRKSGSLNLTYDEAMEAIVRARGFTDDDIAQAGYAPDRSGERRHSGAARPGERRAGEGAVPPA